MYGLKRESTGKVAKRGCRASHAWGGRRLSRWAAAFSARARRHENKIVREPFDC